jgi:hypothetical protein
MKIHPLLNALGAGAYILAVVGIIYALQSPNTPDSGVLGPVFLLGLLTLSAATMAFLFFYQPLRLYMDNERKEALSYFMKTVGYFAAMVFLSFVALMYFRAPDSITFPAGGEKLVQGQTYELTWTGGRDKTLHIFLIDPSIEDEGASVSIADRVYGITNKHVYSYTVPEAIKPGTYQFEIGSERSKAFEIVAK